MSVGYPRAVPELLEVETYRSWPWPRSTAPIARSVCPDAWYLKGAATAVAPAGARRPPVRGGRRIGKLLLLDVDAGPTVGIRFGMTGTLVVDDEPGWTRCSTPRSAGPGVGPVDGPVRRRWLPRGPRSGRLGGVLLDPDVSGLGPDAFVITPAELAGTLGGPGPR